MDYAQRISSLVLSLRKKDRLRVRQPLERILLPILDEDFEMQVEQVKDLILAEVNIKRLEYVHDASGVIKKKIKPNFKTLGRKLGKDMKAAMGIITAMDQDDIARIEQAGVYDLVIEDRTYNLTIEDFEVVSEDIPGWQVAVDRNLTVALDTTLSDELIQEGYARELVNRIQNIRKNNDFDVTDRIHVKISKDDRLDAVIENFGKYIQDETLADSINLVDGMSSEMIDLQEDFSVQIEAERV
jgi:isoleucyl-tRNA synthetase